jgi:hypothetical protein
VTPNPLIKSAKFIHSGVRYLGFCLLRLRRRCTEDTRRTRVNGQFNGQDPLRFEPPPGLNADRKLVGTRDSPPVTKAPRSGIDEAGSVLVKVMRRTVTRRGRGRPGMTTTNLCGPVRRSILKFTPNS